MQSLLTYALQVLTDRGHYTTFSKADHNTSRYLANHPVTGAPFEGDSATWLGSWQMSVSTEFLVRTVLTRMADGLAPTALHIWYFERNPGQFDAIAEIALHYPGEQDFGERYYCSGMTTYSGEGGRAHSTLKKFFEQLALVYPPLVVAYVTVTDRRFDEVGNIIEDVPTDRELEAA